MLTVTVRTIGLTKGSTGLETGSHVKVWQLVWVFFFWCPKNVCEVIFKSDGRKNVEIIWYLEFSMRLLTAFSHLYSKNKAQKDKTNDVKKICSLQIYKDRCGN